MMRAMATKTTLWIGNWLNFSTLKSSDVIEIELDGGAAQQRQRWDRHTKQWQHSSMIHILMVDDDGRRDDLIGWPKLFKFGS